MSFLFVEFEFGFCLRKKYNSIMEIIIFLFFVAIKFQIIGVFSFTANDL